MKDAKTYLVMLAVGTASTLLGLWAYDQINKAKVAKPATTATAAS